MEIVDVPGPSPLVTKSLRTSPSRTGLRGCFGRIAREVCPAYVTDLERRWGKMREEVRLTRYSHGAG